MIDEENKSDEVINDDTVAENDTIEESPKEDEGELESETDKIQDDEESQEEVIVSFGEEEESGEDDNTGERDKKWITDLRQSNRDQSREIRELKHEREQAKAATEQAASPLGDKPTLEDADYDEGIFEGRLTEWVDRKSQFDRKQADVQQIVEKRNKDYDVRLREYEVAATTFNADTYTEAQELVQKTFSQHQQILMVHVSGSKAAELVMAFQRDRTTLKRLAAITDEHLFSAEIARLEGKVTSSTRKPRSAPESRIAATGNAGAGTGASASNSHLDTLRERAAKDGNYTEILKFKREQLQKQAS